MAGACARAGRAPDEVRLVAVTKSVGIEECRILRDLGVRTMRLLTNNPRKFVGLEGYGLSVTESLPLEVVPATEFTRRYMKTKKDKLGHTLKSV